MFEARLMDASMLKQVIEAIGEVVQDANIDCTQDGMSIQAMDPSHVALVSLHIYRQAFEDYRADRSICLGVKVTKMVEVMRCSGKSDIVTLKAEPDSEQVTFLFENESHTRYSQFSLKLMNIDAENVTIPQMDYECVVQMPSASFARICKEMSTIDETIEITCSKQGIKFSATGVQSVGSVALKQADAADDADSEGASTSEGVIVDCSTETTLSFSLRYLRMFAKAAPLNKFVTIRMSDANPIQIAYDIGEDMGSLKYYLAPKIDENDDESSSDEEED